MKSRSIAVFAILWIAALGFSSLAQAEAVQVTTNCCEDSFPHVKGNYLVWQEHAGGDWEVFLYNIATGGTTPITTNGYHDISPQTDGNYVVWLGFSYSGGEIFVYDMASGNTTQITNDDNVDSPPQIANGKVVWASHEVTDSVEPGEIFLYDIANATTTLLSSSDDPLDDSFPRINDDIVVWTRENADGTTTLFVHNLTDGTTGPAEEGFVWADSPQTDGDLTVLSRHDGSDREIFVHNSNIKTYEQVTDNDLEDSYPSISGNNIVWIGGEGKASEIFLCDLCDSQPITGTVSPSTDTLWPPNHSMVPITIDVSTLVTHNPDTQISVTSVAITEYSSKDAGEDYGENIYNENNFEPDVEITGNLTLNLRSERSGPSTGRTYTITVTASDCSGSYTFETDVVVPHDKGK